MFLPLAPCCAHPRRCWKEKLRHGLRRGLRRGLHTCAEWRGAEQAGSHREGVWMISDGRRKKTAQSQAEFVSQGAGGSCRAGCRQRPVAVAPGQRGPGETDRPHDSGHAGPRPCEGGRRAEFREGDGRRACGTSTWRTSESASCARWMPGSTTSSFAAGRRQAAPLARSLQI